MAGRKPISAPEAEQAAAQRIGDNHPAGARHVEQAGNTERRFAAQFERITIGIVLTAQDDVHAFQAAQGLQIDSLAAHGEILPSTSGKPR
jgi:hypothetical protein